jgi:hypothetical protein
MMGDLRTPIIDSHGMRGWIITRGPRCEAVQTSGQSLGLYNNVSAAMDALRLLPVPEAPCGRRAGV